MRKMLDNSVILMITGLPLWAMLAMISPSYSPPRSLGWPLAFFVNTLGLFAVFEALTLLWAPLGPSVPLWAPSFQLPLSPSHLPLGPPFDVGLKLGVEKVKDTIGALPQSAVLTMTATNEGDIGSQGA